jgi:two-component system chemotaxis response regulator CheB
MSDPIRVLVVDDSIFMRSMLRDAISKADGLEVIGTAQNGTEGLQKILCNKPDVVTLDIEMPGMTGLEVLERVMKECPTPCVVVSTKTQKGAQITLDALKLGAVDYVAKPLMEQGSTLEGFRQKVVEAVRVAAASNRKTLTSASRTVRPAARPQEFNDLPMDAIVAIGISAGGPQTLHQMMPAIPAKFPPIVITQHMPAAFTSAFAERLNAECKLEVREAVTGDELRPGVALIAPGDQHLRVVQRGSKFSVVLSNGPKISGFRPSVDAMFDSLAAIAAERTVAVVMTGMGFDGAAGIRMLKQRGAATIAQDAETSIVYGMPKAAAETGCVDRIVPLHQIPSAIAEALRTRTATAR